MLNLQTQRYYILKKDLLFVILLRVQQLFKECTQGQLNTHRIKGKKKKILKKEKLINW